MKSLSSTTKTDMYGMIVAAVFASLTFYLAATGLPWLAGLTLWAGWLATLATDKKFRHNLGLMLIVGVMAAVMVFLAVIVVYMAVLIPATYWAWVIPAAKQLSLWLSVAFALSGIVVVMMLAVNGVQDLMRRGGHFTLTF